MSCPKIGVLLAERRLLHVQEERLPLRRGRDAGDERGQEAHAQAAPPDPATHAVAAWLEQVAGGGDAVARRQPARELHVELDDDEEERERDDADEHLPPDARPEDGAEADLAEPQPVDVETEDAAPEDEHEDDDRDDDRPDDAAPRVPAAPRLGRRLLGTEWADVVHGVSMADSRRL